MKTRLAVMSAILALLGWVPRLDACAGCRNPSLPVLVGNQGPLLDGDLRLGAMLAATTIRVVHEAGCNDLDDCSEVPAQPLYLHDQLMVPVELRLSAELGLSDAWGVELQLPLRTVVTTIEYTTPEGEHYEPLDADVHHRDERLFGLGDPWLLLRVGTLVNGTWLSARAGLTLPLGKTEENPFELGDQGLRHQHIQFGSGTFDPVLILEAARRVEELQLQAFLQAQTALYENRHDYQAPLRIYAGLAAGAELWKDVRAMLGPEAFHEGPDRWQGVVRQDAGLGRTDLLLAGMVSWTLDETQLLLGLRVPLYRHVIVGDEPPGQLSSPLAVTLGVSRNFDGDR